MISGSGRKSSSTQINSRSCKLISTLILTDGTNAATATIYDSVLGSLTQQNIVATSLPTIDSATSNKITLAYTAGAVAGSEVVSVSANAISVQISTGVSTATQVLAALNGAAPATALASFAITGTASTPQVTASAVRLTGASGDASILSVAKIPGASFSAIYSPSNDKGIEANSGLYLVLAGTGAAAIVYYKA